MKKKIPVKSAAAKTPSKKAGKSSTAQASSARSAQRLPAQPSPKVITIAVVTSRFNEAVTLKLQEAALDYLEEMGVDILSVNVPGAIEIPITIQALFESHNVDGAVALGAVIRGETTHYDEVCRSVERACTTLMLEHKKPIGFGILTTENEAQALDRAGGEHGNKGTDAAETVLEMIGLLNEIRKNK